MQVLAPDGTPLLSLVYRTDFAEYVENAPLYGEFTGPLIGCPSGVWSTDSPFESIPFLDRGQTAFVIQRGLEDDKFAMEAGAIIVVADDPSSVQRKGLFGYVGFGTAEDYPAAVIVTPQAAERLCQAAGASGTTGLSPLRVHIDIPVEAGSLDETHYNVIGYLPGTGANTRGSRRIASA
jgi:hypothetical protein